MSITGYGLQDIKKELPHLSPQYIHELILRLARYKKDNKELLAYLLFEAHNEMAFIEKVKSEIAEMFAQLPPSGYYTAKALRKTLRLIAKYVRFIGAKIAELELLICFCYQFITYVKIGNAYKPLRSIFLRQLEKIRALIKKLDDDLQLDFVNEYENLIDDTNKKLTWFSIDENKL